jgi:hypothetical protein
MSQQQRAIYRLLLEHEYVVHHSTGAICVCGFVPTVLPSALATQQDYHRGHVASVLAEAISR